MTRASDRPVRALFLMSHAGYTRNFESTIRGLADRGHATTIAVDRVKGGAGSDTSSLLDAVVREYAEVSSVQTPRITAEAQEWLDLARGARLGLDCLRYLEPPFHETPKLTARAFKRLQGPLRLAVERARTSPASYRESLRRALSAVHDGIPPLPLYVDFVRDQRPDVVLLTPLLELGSNQHEQMRAARALGVPVVLLVHSWDNLTTKGFVRLAPDLVAVWNDAQRREAVELHGIDPARVIVTGAPAWDHWFDWQPSTTREEFCAKLGLDSGVPFVVYLGSSAFIAPAEADAVLEWVQGIREATIPELRDVGIVVRPHPTNPVLGEEPAQRALEARDDVVLYPRDGQNPTDRESRQDYFDSLFHSAAVVGVNTSAFLESAIVGHPAHTILSPDYRETQKGTVHFRHLTDDADGLLHVAVSARQHAEQLHASISGAPEAAARSRHFVEVFIRPAGRDVAATPALLEAIEQTARTPGWPVRSRGTSRAAAWAVHQAMRGAARAPQPPVERVRAAGRTAREMFKIAPDPTRKLAAAPAAPSKPAAAKKPSRAESVPTLPPSAPASTPAPAPPPGTLAAHRWSRQAADDAVRADVPEWTNEKIDRAEDTARARLLELADSGDPVIAGPWTGEVGYELLYWIPMLRWAVRVEPRLADRLHVVSRGGAGSWYADLGARYADVLELSERDEYLERRTPQKQRRETRYDAELLVRAREHFGLDSAVGLHPSVLFRLYFGGVKPDPMVYARTVRSDDVRARGWTSEYAPLSREAAERPAWLPDRFLAVRFYHRKSFPEDPRVTRFVADVVAALVDVTEVVLLDSGARLDEHTDVVVAGARAHRMSDHVAPRRNLAQQTDVIAHADGFVGTYGGLAYLPPMLGLPSLTFSSTIEGLQPWHDALATRLFDAEPWGAYRHHHIDELSSERIEKFSVPEAARVR